MSENRKLIIEAPTSSSLLSFLSSGATRGQVTGRTGFVLCWVLASKLVIVSMVVISLLSLFFVLSMGMLGCWEFRTWCLGFKFRVWIFSEVSM